jgi:phospholipid/cholesterol/gamma-HCH transport system substrate-binding protein
MSILGKQATSTVKVGVLTLVSLGILVFALIWLRGRGLSNGEPQDVYFKDVNGMREGAAVQMMGIRVGFVDMIAPAIKDKRYYVHVRFRINPDLGINIPKGSRLSIEQSGIIGEQFIEITPPQLREITLTTFRKPAKPITKGIPVKFLYEEGFKEVGKVEDVVPTEDGNLTRYRLYYRITLPGADMPEDPLFELAIGKEGQYYLRILPREPVIAQAPDPNLQYTIENPMRMKRFLEIQMESAAALKLTNDKINQLLSDESIESMHSTLKNTEVLTARASEILESANVLFQTTRQDLDRLATVSEKLAGNVASVTDNLNDIIGDPKLKTEMTSTVASLRESSNAMRELLNDPALKETIYMARDTSQNAAELISVLKQTAADRNLHERMDRIVTQLDTSLDKLNGVLGNVDALTDDKDATLKGTVEDIRATAKNLRQLSGKFNGRFTLFKLMF